VIAMDTGARRLIAIAGRLFTALLAITATAVFSYLLLHALSPVGDSSTPQPVPPATSTVHQFPNSLDRSS
jgi:hypothetical protein